MGTMSTLRPGGDRAVDEWVASIAASVGVDLVRARELAVELSIRTARSLPELARLVPPEQITLDRTTTLVA